MSQATAQWVIPKPIIDPVPFYWIFALMCGFLFVVSVAQTLISLMHPRNIEFSESAIWVPSGFMHMRTTSLPYASVKDISETGFSYLRILRLQEMSGEVCLTSYGLDGDGYDVMKRMLNDRVEQAESNIGAGHPRAF